MSQNQSQQGQTGNQQQNQPQSTEQSQSANQQQQNTSKTQEPTAEQQIGGAPERQDYETPHEHQEPKGNEPKTPEADQENQQENQSEGTA